MDNVIILGIIGLILIFAIYRGIRHFTGGGCCGSGGNTIRDKKELTEPVIGEYILMIQGMHCENCQIRVENALNRLDGVLCHVHLRKKEAVVSYTKETDPAVLRQCVEALGYTVTEIR